MAQGNMFRKQRSVARTANPMGDVLRGGAPTPYNGPGIDERVTPEQAFYMQQRNPFTPSRMQEAFQGNVPLAGPMSPQQRTNSAIRGMDAGFKQDMDFVRSNPVATGSLGASSMAGAMTAYSPIQSRVANGYVGQAQISSPFDEQASRARAQEYMRGGPAADPTNLAGRFGNVAPRISDEQRRAQDYATSQAAMAERMRTQMPTDRAQNVFVKPSRDGQGLAYTDRGQALRNMPENTPGLADAIALDDAQRQANTERMAKRLEDYKAANGGMNAQAVGRQRLQDRREQGKYNKAIRQGLNPMSPQAQALFPGQTQSFMQRRQANRGGTAVQNPMAAPERTMAGQQQSAQRVAELAATSPAIAGLGVKPDQGMIGLHTALGQRLDEDPNLNLSDDELKAYQQYAREMGNLSTDQNNQFDFGGTPFDKYSGELWKELAGLPDNQRAREDWLKKYKGRNNAATGAATAIPPVGTYFMGGPVGR